MNELRQFAGQLWLAVHLPAWNSVAWPLICVGIGIFCFLRARLLSDKGKSGGKASRMIGLGMPLIVFGLIWLTFALVLFRI